MIAQQYCCILLQAKNLEAYSIDKSIFTEIGNVNVVSKNDNVQVEEYCCEPILTHDVI